MDKGEEARSKLIVARGDPAGLLELEEELFHKMAFLVEPPIDIPRIGLVFSGWDAEIRIMIGDKLAQRPFAVSFVRKNGRTFQANPAEQFFSDSDIVGVASGQHNLNRIAQSVHNGVNLGTSAASTDADALINLGFLPGSVWLLAGGFYGISGLWEPPLSAPALALCALM